MNFLIALTTLFLNLIEFYETCELSGEMCVCKRVLSSIEMSCQEKSSASTPLIFNEITIRENVLSLKITLENKFYVGVRSSISDPLSLKIITLTIINSQKLTLEANSFQYLTNLLF